MDTHPKAAGGAPSFADTPCALPHSLPRRHIPLPPTHSSPRRQTSLACSPFILLDYTSLLTLPLVNGENREPPELGRYPLSLYYELLVLRKAAPVIPSSTKILIVFFSIIYI